MQHEGSPSLLWASLKLSFHVRNAQELKEFCEKQKWRLPSYEFSSGPEGRGYVCRLTLPDADIRGMQSGLQPNQKAAKAEVSVDGLKVARIFAAQQEHS